MGVAAGLQKEGKIRSGSTNSSNLKKEVKEYYLVKNTSGNGKRG